MRPAAARAFATATFATSTRSPPTLTMSAADSMAYAALVRARELGLPSVAVAVCDSGGDLVVLKREDGCPRLISPIAISKAASCTAFHASTRALRDKVRRVRASALRGGRVAWGCACEMRTRARTRAKREHESYYATTTSPTPRIALWIVRGRQADPASRLETERTASTAAHRCYHHS